MKPIVDTRASELNQTYQTTDLTLTSFLRCRGFAIDNIKQNKVVCTEGPYVLATGSPTKADVNIDCGKAPAALWLLAAGAGTAAAIALATNSTSN